MKTILYLIIFLFSGFIELFADEIYLKDNRIIECEIIQITADVIIYKLIDLDQKQVIVRENISKIINPEGNEIQISDTQLNSQPSATDEKKSEEYKFELFTLSGGFIDSYIRLGVTGGIGAVWGDLHRKENQSYNRYINQAKTYPVYPNGSSKREYHYRFISGYDFAIFLPAIKIPRAYSFALMGVKFGITANYIYSTTKQDLEDESLKDTDYYRTLLKYRTLNIGPEVNFIIGPISNTVNLVFRCFSLGGRIHKGEITALPCLREAGLSLNKSEYSANFDGYSATTGAGIRFVLNRAVPLITGFDVQYTYSKINFDKALPVYKGARSTSFSEIGLTFSLGIHI